MVVAQREHEQHSSRLPPRKPKYSLLETRPQTAILVLVAVAAALIGIQAPTAGRALIGLFGFAVFVLIAMRNRRGALAMVFVFLILLGFIRRALIPFTGWADNDPLLLVSPAAAFVFWYLGRGVRPRRGFMSSAAAVLLLWCIGQLLNPNEPDFVIALQSLLFYITPVLWFFAGRTFESDDHEVILRLIFWMNVPVVALGLYHSFGRFFPFELTWVGVSHQGPAIFLPGFQVRPFSTLTSPQEYGFFLAFALMVIWGRLLHRPRHPLVLGGAFFITAAALFLQASRSIFLLFLIGVAVTSLLRYRSPFTVLCLLLVAGLLVAYANGVRGTVTEETDVVKPTKSAWQALVDHELVGLSDPSSGTGPVHVDLVTTGLTTGIENPLGLGVSHGSIAEVKSAPGRFFSSESDIGNVAAGLGVFAGLTLLFFIVVSVMIAFRVEIARPSARHLTVVGFCVVSFGQWATGGLYATSSILWFFLGGLAREWYGSASTDGLDLRTRAANEAPTSRSR